MKIPTAQHSAESRQGLERAFVPRPDLIATLTRRELQVLAYVSADYSDLDIGLALGVCDRTISAHVRQIIDKLGARTRTGAARIYCCTVIVARHAAAR